MYRHIEVEKEKIKLIDTEFEKHRDEIEQLKQLQKQEQEVLNSIAERKKKLEQVEKMYTTLSERKEAAEKKIEEYRLAMKDKKKVFDNQLYVSKCMVWLTGNASVARVQGEYEPFDEYELSEYEEARDLVKLAHETYNKMLILECAPYKVSKRHRECKNDCVWYPDKSICECGAGEYVWNDEEVDYLTDITLNSEMPCGYPSAYMIDDDL